MNEDEFNGYIQFHKVNKKKHSKKFFRWEIIREVINYYILKIVDINNYPSSLNKNKKNIFS